MKVAIIMYDKLNLLNFAQINAFLRQFDGVKVRTYALKPEIVDEYGLQLRAEVFGESLYGADALIVPDGLGALSLRYDEIFLSWIKSGSGARVKIGLDLGSLVFGGAGFLDGKSACVRAGYKNALGEYCEFVADKICVCDDVVSVCEWGDEARGAILKKLNLE